MSIRIRVLGLAAIVVLLALAGFTTYWFHVAGQLRKGLAEFAADRRAAGWQLQFPRDQLSGFPLAVVLDLGEASLATPAGIGWASDGLRLVVPAFDPLGPVLELGRTHRLALGPWRGLIASGGASVGLRVDGDGDLNSFRFRVDRPVLEQPGEGPLGAAWLEIGYSWLNPPRPGHETPSARFEVKARQVEMTLPAHLPFERRLAVFELEGQVLGTIPEAEPLAALDAWSREGGTLEFTRLAAEWGALVAEGDGTLAFDSSRQPLLATVLRLRGWNALLGQLTQAGILEPGAASAAEMLLAILSRPDPQGRPTLTLSVNVQDGHLYAGQARLVKLPPLPIPPPAANQGNPPS